MKSIYKQPSIYNGKSIYNGNGIYNGYDSLPPCKAMTFRFKFSDLTYDPVDAGVGTSGTWNQVRENPNIWDWKRNDNSWVNSFSGAFTDSQNLVDVIDAGDISSVVRLVSTFSGCTSLVSLCDLETTNLQEISSFLRNCSGLKKLPDLVTDKITATYQAFYGCVLVETGALNLYNKMSTQETPPTSKSGTFINCGRNTPTGLAELQQIPESWGGLAPTIDGRTYPVVKIGSQYWITENLKYKTTNSEQFINYPEFGQYYPKSDLSSVTSALPTGWRIPTQSDYNTLFGNYSTDYVHSLQSTGYSGFPRATNSTGLSIVPSRRAGIADFTIAYLWTTTDGVLAQVNADSATFTNVVNPSYKYCIRLVKDA